MGEVKNEKGAVNAVAGILVYESRYEFQFNFNCDCGIYVKFKFIFTLAVF